MQITQLQNAQTGTGTGTAADLRTVRNLESRYKDYASVVVKTSAGTSVSVQIEVSADNTNWVPFGSAFTTVNSGEVVSVPIVPFIRANVTANSGVTVNAWLVS